MARVVVAAQTLPGAYPTLPISPGSRVVAFQATDASLHNYVTIVEGKTVVLVQNGHATDAKTVTFISVADAPFGRSGDITTYSVAAGDVAAFGPFKAGGWLSPAGASPTGLYVDASSADIKLAVITLP